MQRGSPPMSPARRSPLSTGAAAAVAGCHPVTIWRAIERGDLEAVRLGPTGAYRIDPRSLEEWLRPAHNPEEETS